MADETPSEASAAQAAVDNPELMAAVKRFVGIGVQWPVTITLRTPIHFGKETIESLVFQKGNFGVLKGLELDATQEPSMDALMVIASRLCGRPLGVIERVDPDDVEEVLAMARGFFARCQGAGNKLSGM